jgi:hypothetical protein
MANLITDPMGQQMAGQAAPPTPAPGGLAQAATDQQQNAPIPQDQAAGSAQDPRAVGSVQNRQQAQSQANDDDPTAKVPATPAEQAQYTQLVNRYVLMISDMRPSPSGQSPLELALRMMNNPKLPLPAAIGYATAQLIFILHHGAKVQKFSYDPDVMFHAADECVASTYLLGLARGLFKGMPPFKGLGEGDNGYPFETAEINVIGHAKLYAVQRFGAMMQAAGEITVDERQQAVDFWNQQIQREIKSGAVDESVIEQMQKGPDTLLQSAQSKGLNEQGQQPPPSQGIAPAQSPANQPPPSQPPQPPQGAPAPGGQ